MLDVAIKLCVTHKGTLLRAVLVIVVPVQILATVITLSTIGDDYQFGFGDVAAGTPSPEDESEVDLDTFLAGQFVILVLAGLTYLLATGACFRAIAQAYIGEPTDWKASLRFALRRAPALLWLSILYGIGLTFGFLALIIPGIYLAVAWAVSFPALLVEDVRGRRALARSFRLVRGSWWRTFSILFIGYLLAAVVASMVQFAIALPVFVVVDEESAVAVVLTTLSSIAGQAISTPLTVAIAALVYFDLRVRKEGFDLELLAERMGVERGAAGEGAAPVAPAARFLPPEGAVDRSLAPYWPPPPGWKPPDPEADPDR